MRERVTGARRACAAVRVLTPPHIAHVFAQNLKERGNVATILGPWRWFGRPALDVGAQPTSGPAWRPRRRRRSPVHFLWIWAPIQSDRRVQQRRRLQTWVRP